MTLPISDTAMAVDALRDVIRAALPVPPAADAVMVYDGPAPERAYMGRAVTVGEAFLADQDAVTVARAESGARPTVTETITVAGSVYVGTGSTASDVWEGYRADAGAILSAIDAALQADRRLGGAVGLARLASAQWLQGRDAQGTGVVIGYTVDLVSLS